MWTQFILKTNKQTVQQKLILKPMPTTDKVMLFYNMAIVYKAFSIAYMTEITALSSQSKKQLPQITKTCPMYTKVFP